MSGRSIAWLWTARLSPSQEIGVVLLVAIVVVLVIKGALAMKQDFSAWFVEEESSARTARPATTPPTGSTRPRTN